MLERNVRSIAVLDSLRQGFQPPEVLFQDYTASKPVVEIFAAFANGHSLLGYTMLTSPATALYTVLLGALQVSASFYGATTFANDLICAIACLILNLYLLLVTLLIAWSFSRNPCLKRPPGTMASMLPLVLSSDKLREDADMVAPKASQSEKIECLENARRRYGFGYFYNDGNPNDRHYGIKRDETGA